MNNNWVDECLRLFREVSVEKAILFAKSRLPSKLYKFQKLDDDDYTLNNLKNGNYYLANIYNANDCYECYPTINFDRHVRYLIRNDILRMEEDGYKVSDQEKKGIELSYDPFNTFVEILKNRKLDILISKEEYRKQQHENANSTFKIIKDNVRIYSFTERNDSTVMWSHYADNHRGICLEYDTNTFTLDIPLFPVTYSDDRYDMTDFPEFKGVASLTMMYKGVLTKAKDWSYEKEWRLIYHLNPKDDNGDHTILKAPLPTAIYIGSMFENNPPYKIENFYKIAESLKIPIRQMAIEHTKYSMIPKE